VADLEGGRASSAPVLGGLQMIRAKYDSRKLTWRFAQWGMIRAILWCFAQVSCYVVFLSN